jgi:hypothetical protein
MEKTQRFITEIRCMKATRTPWCWFGALLWFGLSACTPGFNIEQIDSETYVPSEAVVWLDHEPERPYIILARFQGTETGYCPVSTPNCSLIRQANRLGAQAIWVQHRDRSVRPELWVDIQGRMTRIPESVQETLEGVLIRYR